MLLKELDKNKKKVFQVILAFTAVAGVGFAVINYSRGQHTLASIELIAAVSSFVLLFYVNKTTRIENFIKLTLIYVTIFFSIMMFALASEGVSITIFAWVLIIPLVSYLLLGLRIGFYITALFYTISTYIFITGFTSHPIMQESVAYANLFVCALLFWAVSHSYELSNKTAKKQLRKMANSDHLTGLFNRTTLNQLFKETVNQANNKHESVSWVLFDLDGFKNINDEFGHEAGDHVLIQFAQIIQHAVYDKGYAFRIGGEEFAVLFSAESDLMVLSLAENVRRNTEKIIIQNNPEDKKVSVSAGVVTERPHNAELNTMMKVADRRMYHGKSQGRNVVIHKG